MIDEAVLSGSMSSVVVASIECMFDWLPVPAGMAGYGGYLAEVVAHRRALVEKTGESVGWVARIGAAARVVNQGAAAELVAIGVFVRAPLGVRR